MEQVSGKRRCARGRTILFLGKQFCRTYRIQEELLVLIISMIISEKWLLRNTFGLKAFLSREPVFMMMWACPLPRHNRHKQRVRMGFVFENKYYGKTPIACCLRDKKSGWKKKEKVFFSFPRDSLFTIAPMSRSNYPALSMCTPLTIRA